MSHGGNHIDSELYNKLKCHRRELAKSIREAKRVYYRDKLTYDKASVQQIWKVYSELMGRNRKKGNIVNKLIVDGTEYSTDEDIADTFNTFFSTIDSELARTFPDNDNYKKYMNKYVGNSMFVTPLSRGDLLTLIKTLDKKKSCGPDDISPGIICQHANQIVDPLHHIFNLSLTQGVFPTKLKLAKVIPIYKKTISYKSR